MVPNSLSFAARKQKHFKYIHDKFCNLTKIQEQVGSHFNLYKHAKTDRKLFICNDVL